MNGGGLRYLEEHLPGTTHLPAGCTRDQSRPATGDTATGGTRLAGSVGVNGLLRTLDKEDPVKYDFALFGTGVMENKKSTLSLIRYGKHRTHTPAQQRPAA